MSRAKQPNIEVSVSPTGEITIEAEGYTGSSCEDATRFLEEALGLAATRTRKAEFYQRRPKNHSQQHLRT